MKIENQNVSLTKKKFYDSIVKNEEKDFLKVIKKLQSKEEKSFSVYAIAAKIARGETVTAEELQYIKENAPSLYEAAVRQNEERIENERDTKHTDKEVKPTKAPNETSKDSIENGTDSTTGKADNTGSIHTVISNVTLGI